MHSKVLKDNVKESVLSFHKGSPRDGLKSRQAWQSMPLHTKPSCCGKQVELGKLSLISNNGK